MLLLISKSHESLSLAKENTYMEDSGTKGIGNDWLDVSDILFRLLQGRNEHTHKLTKLKRTAFVLFQTEKYEIEICLLLDIFFRNFAKVK